MHEFNYAKVSTMGITTVLQCSLLDVNVKILAYRPKDFRWKSELKLNKLLHLPIAIEIKIFYLLLSFLIK